MSKLKEGNINAKNLQISTNLNNNDNEELSKEINKQFQIFTDLNNNYKNSEENIFDYKMTTSAELEAQLQEKIKSMPKLHKFENFKDKYGNKNTFKIFTLINGIQSKQDKDIKINKMMSPYNHLEYSPNNKRYNFIKDNFKKHAEEILRFKHIERGETKRTK